ncbi:MAG TPA: hypothetical protein PLY93_13120, partial [Turneriella sp.]|nr:hypothetical protein [Turneriella sp.]
MLSGFERLSTQEDGERFSVCFDGALFPFYSRRSRPRDVALFKRAIEETPPEMTPILVAPFIADVEEIFTLPRRFYFLAPLFFDTPQIDDARFIGDDAALHQFLRGVESVDKFSIYLPPPWKEAAPYVETGVRQILAQAAARLKTIHHFARLWQTNLRVNARRVINYVDVRTLKESR